MRPTAQVPAVADAELIAEPSSNDRGARRRFFAVVQAWRNWLYQEIDRSQPGNRDLVQRGVDDLLFLTFLVQFIRDRKREAIPALDQVLYRQAGLSLGQWCGELQGATPCPVLKAVVDPAPFAGQVVIPAAVMQRACWKPIIQASRRIYGSRLPVTIFGDLHQWCLSFAPDETAARKRGVRSDTRRYDKGIHYTPAALVNHLTARVLGCAGNGLALEQVLKRRILDPSCGCGVFLVAALRYLFARLVLLCVIPEIQWK